jgi:hypothetical protein
VEDDVRRDTALTGDVEAQRAKPLEEISIDILPGLGLDARTLRRLPGDRPALAGERQPRLSLRILQQRDA